MIGYWWVLITFELTFYLAFILLPKSENDSLLYVIPFSVCWAAAAVLVRILTAGIARRSPADWSHHLIFAAVAIALLILGYYTEYFGYAFIWLVPVSVIIYIVVTVWTATALFAKSSSE